MISIKIGGYTEVSEGYFGTEVPVGEKDSSPLIWGKMVNFLVIFAS